ncbi:hypothetical protein D0499_05035 [Weissella soli]|nr:hypothetical protein [Weissella soli]
MIYEDELIEEINKRLTKQLNKLYWVRIVCQRFSKMINVFFEYGEIHSSPTSKQIGEYDRIEKDRMHELGRRIERETNVRVEFSGFDE